jgi:diguanylate cyclase (GGDEF)-like protein
VGPRVVRTVTYVLDGLVVAGAVFLLTWSTALGAVVRAEAPTTLSFAVAIHYPIVDLLLVAIVGLLAMTGRVPSPLRVQLWLLGAAMVAFLVSDSILAYLVTTRAEEMPPATDLGYIAAPLLIGIAALARADDPAAAGTAGAGRLAQRAHLLLPYVLVALTGAVVAVQSALGARIDRVEAAAAWIVLGLVLLRQIITLVQNTVLLERVSAARAELAYRAQHDPLTGLANRSLFGERLQGAMEVHREHGQPYALLLVDLDDFKAINDSLGHAAGDRLLQAVGGRLRACVRATDTVARLGGDEFAVVLCGAAEEPGIVGQRIIDALRHPFRIDGRTLSLGASIGVVEPDGDDAELTPELLLRRADGAMYVGKARGKGVAVTYAPDLLGDDLPSRAV